MMRSATRRPALALAVSLALTWSAEPAIQALPNVLVNDPATDATERDTQSGTALVLGAAGTLVAAFNDTGSSVGGASHLTGWARSTNGGASWTDLGILPNSTDGDGGYPTLARSASTGTIVLATEGRLSGAVIQVFRSTSDGASFAPPVNGAAGGGTLDKPWLAADNVSGVGQGNFYLSFRDSGPGGGLIFTRSTDDGVTWTDRRLLGAGQGAWVVVGVDHAIYAFWLSGTTLLVRKSRDGGLNFDPATTVATLRTTGPWGDLGLGGGFTTNAFPQVVANPNDPQQLYAVYNDTALSGPDKANVYLTRTMDGGASWSVPEQVNMDGGTNDNWGPVVAITPDGTGLFVSWYDRRLDPSNSLIDIYGRSAKISGTNLTLGADYRITDAPFPVVRGQDPALSLDYMGDYDTAVADNATYYRTWGDNRLAQGIHSHQPDVRFAAIPKDGPGPVLAAAGVTIAAESCTPLNQAIEPGEAVVVTLGLTNFGSAATLNLVGSLEATGGVTLQSGPQSFGAVGPGSTVARTFNFTAAGTCGGTITANLRLQDGPVDRGSATFKLLLGAPLQIPLAVSNAGGILIQDLSAAFPYPSTLTVAGFSGPISRATVTLGGLTHTFPADVDVLLVGPGGQKALFMSDVGAGNGVNSINLTFDDLAASSPGATLSSGTFLPTNLDENTDVFPAPAPAGPYTAPLAAFAGLSGPAANGVWNLYVRDDNFIDSGSIFGWTLNLYGFSCSTSCAQTVPLRYFTLAPCRLVDTRGAAGSLGGPALQAATDRSFPVSGTCGVPPQAQALALNVTAVSATSGGHLRLFAGSTPRPEASAISFDAGRTRANNAVVNLGTGGVLTVFDGQPSGTVHCVLDVSGYFAGWP
ncbi:MAG: hypothetical protein ABI609_07555 [Acidobacteriota bacterium]